MSKIVGRLKNVGIALETSRGAGRAAQYWLAKNKVSVDDKVVKARSKLSYNVLNSEGNQAIPAKQWAEGELEFDMQTESFGVILKALLGAISSGSVVDQSYTHTFSIDNTSTPNQHPSIALTMIDTSIQTTMFKLAMIDSMEITIVPEEVVMVNVKFMSKQGVPSSASASYVPEHLFVGRHLSFKLATLTSGLSAATKIPIKSLKIKFEKNLRLDHNLGTVEPQDIQNQAMRISGEVELDYADRTYRDLTLNGSYRAMRIDLTNTNDVIASGSTRPAFKIDFSRVDFEAWEPAFPNDDIASQKFSFTCLYDLVNGNVINSCTLVNGVSSYA